MSKRNFNFIMQFMSKRNFSFEMEGVQFRLLQLLSLIHCEFSCNYQSSMRAFHNINARMQNISNFVSIEVGMTINVTYS